MSYLNRVCMAASVAVVQGHPDHGWKSSLKSLQHGKRRLFSTGDTSEFRALSSAVIGSDRAEVPGSPSGVGFGNGQSAPESAPECGSVYGAEDGDT